MAGLLAQLVVSAGDLRREIERRLEHIVDFLEYLGPGGGFLLRADFADAILELGDARFVRRKILADTASDLFQLQGDGLRALQFAPRLISVHFTAFPLRAATDQITDSSDGRQRDDRGQIHVHRFQGSSAPLERRGR